MIIIKNYNFDIIYSRTNFGEIPVNIIILIFYFKNTIKFYTLTKTLFGKSDADKLF